MINKTDTKKGSAAGFNSGAAVIRVWCEWHICRTESEAGRRTGGNTGTDRRSQRSCNPFHGREPDCGRQHGYKGGHGNCISGYRF